MTLSFVIWSITLCIISTWTLDKTCIHWSITYFIFWVNIFCRTVNYGSIADLIPSSSRSFRLLNRVAWSRLGEFSTSSMVIASGVRLLPLGIDLPLVCVHLLVKGVAPRVGDSIGVSKICPPGVLGRSGRQFGVAGVVHYSGLRVVP